MLFLLELLFFINILLILISSFLSVSSNNIIHSVFWLVFSFIISSFFLFLIDLTFLGLILLLVYVGGILILLIFSLMLVRVTDKKNKSKIFTLNILFLSLLYLIIINISFSNTAQK